MSIGIVKLGLALAGIGGVAFVASKAASTTKGKGKGKRKGIGGLKAETSKNLPICMKYPGGVWFGERQVDGYPKSNPGWNDEDIAMVRAAVAAETEDAPPYDGLVEARELTFRIVRKIFAELCPSTKLPQTRYMVENFKKKSLGFRHMWDQLDTMVWNKITAAVT